MQQGTRQESQSPVYRRGNGHRGVESRAQGDFTEPELKRASNSETHIFVSLSPPVHGAGRTVVPRGCEMGGERGVKGPGCQAKVGSGLHSLLQENGPMFPRLPACTGIPPPRSLYHGSLSPNVPPGRSGPGTRVSFLTSSQRSLLTPLPPCRLCCLLRTWAESTEIFMSLPTLPPGGPQGLPHREVQLYNPELTQQEGEGNRLQLFSLLSREHIFETG